MYVMNKVILIQKKKKNLIKKKMRSIVQSLISQAYFNIDTQTFKFVLVVSL
jgi:hypothetical protein